MNNQALPFDKLLKAMLHHMLKKLKIIMRDTVSTDFFGLLKTEYLSLCNSLPTKLIDD